MNLGISRKQFLRVAVLGTAGFAVVPNLLAAPGEKVVPVKPSVFYRIRPLPGKKYSRSFLNFSERMTFTSAAEAIRRVQDRSQGYLLVTQPV